MTGQVCLNKSEYYEPKANEWINIADMTCRRSGLSCISFRNYLYVMGGFDGHTRLRSCEKYNPDDDKWTDVPDMSFQRSNFAIEILDDMIFVIGGYNGRTLSHNECFSVAKNVWYALTLCTIYFFIFIIKMLG